MPEVVRVLLIALVSLLGFYLLLLIVDLIFITSFKHILQKHEKGFTIVLANKLEDLKRIFEVMKTLGAEPNNKYYEIMENIEVKDFVGQSTPKCQKARETLTYLKNEALLIANEHNDFDNNPDFISVKQNLLNEDKIYRKYVAMYNADILGYNYWIRFLPWRWLYLLLKIQTKEII